MNGSKLHLWKNKRFTHLLAGNFILWASVFGALVLGVLLISRWYSVQSVYDQFGEVNCSTLKRRIADMENDIRNKRHIMLRVAGSDDIAKYFRTSTLFASDYETYQVCRRIHEDLMSYCLWDENINSLFLFNESKGQVISSDYATTNAEHYLDTSWSEAYRQLKSGEKVDPFLRESGSYYNHRTVLTLMQSVPIIRSQCSGAVVMNLDCQHFFDSLFGENSYVVTDRKGEILSSGSFPEKLFMPDQLPGEILNQSGNHLVKIGQQRVLITVDCSQSYGWWIYSIDLLQSYNARIVAFDRIMSMLIAVGLAMVLVFSYMLSVRMFVPVKHIMYVLEERKDEMIMPLAERRSLRNELTVIADAVSHTLDRNRELSSILEERLQRLNQVRLRLLQGQVNPHFLYNTLASINWMVLEKLPDDNEISDALCSLSELLRDRLKNTGFISLEEELKQVERYVTLQKLCFADALELTYAPEDGVDQCAIPAMLIQTLVENAVKHGLDKTSDSTLHIRIGARRMEEQLHICVEDDGRGISPADLLALQRALEKDNSDPSQAIGLSNVCQQLRLLFGTDALVHLDGTPGNGFKVEILIPAIQMSDLGPA